MAVIWVLTEHINVENSRLHAGLEPIKAICSDLYSEVELDNLCGMGIENRAICRAIGLKFAGSSEMICTNNLINAIEKILKLRFKYDRA